MRKNRNKGITIRVSRPIRAAISMAPRLTFKAMATLGAWVRGLGSPYPTHLELEGPNMPRLAFKPEGPTMRPRLALELGRVDLDARALEAVTDFLELYDWVSLELRPIAGEWGVAFVAYGVPYYHALIAGGGQVEEVEA